jgi:hypothetical protein
MGMPKVDGHAYEKQQVQGHTLNNRTVAMLTDVESRLGYDLTVLQGSYNAGGVSQSAGTHDGGGAVDLAPYDWKNKVAALRRVGFAAWHREAIPGTWGEHIHAIAYGDRDLSPAAAAQIADYQNHLDGLAGNNYDTQTPHPKLSDFDYQAFRQVAAAVRAAGAASPGRVQARRRVAGPAAEADRRQGRPETRTEHHRIPAEALRRTA